MAATDTQLNFLTIYQAGELMRKGELSPVELTRACLDRIQDTDGQLHSFILLLADEALEQARVAEAEILSGNYKGPMHGIPFALKDLYDTAGVRTTSGSYVDIDRVPTEDATTTARLKAAGGILLGKLAMHEFALGGPDWTTPFEPARNPWNLDHITGGSSSGSGSAVASGLAVSPLDTELILLANTDARVATIESTIGKICNSVSDGDTVFFMFAGHGFGYSENGRTLGLCLTSESLFEKGERPLLKPTLVLSEAPLKVLGHISPCSSRGTLLRSKIATALRVVAVWGICGVRSARRTPFTG